MADNLNCPEKTDEELAKLSIDNPDWFLHLATRYEEKLFRYIKRISGMSKEDVEDIYQEVLIKTYLHLTSFDPGLKFSSWIYRIAHNETINAMRKKSVRPVVYLEDEDLHRFSDTLDISKDIERSFDRDIIEKILSRIDSKYSEVLYLRYLEEKDYVEIADILKKPVSTVGNLISRGKNVFKKEYEVLSNTKSYD